MKNSQFRTIVSVGITVAGSCSNIGRHRAGYHYQPNQYQHHCHDFLPFAALVLLVIHLHARKINSFYYRMKVYDHTPVSYTHLDVYKRQLYNSGTYANNLLILFEFAAVIVCHRKYPC